MAFSSRQMPGHLRQGSSSQTPSTGQSAALLARISEKKAELENLKDLRELSADVANQMEALEQKLSTLSDGTEAIATVVGNWNNVLRAIYMASAKLSKPESQDETSDNAQDDRIALPQTLVRIPTEHAPALQAQADGALEADPNSSVS